MQLDAEIADCSAIIEAYKRDEALNVALVGIYQRRRGQPDGDDLPPARQCYTRRSTRSWRDDHRRRNAERRLRFLSLVVRPAHEASNSAGGLSGLSVTSPQL
jgi:hypothetical protein